MQKNVRLAVATYTNTIPFLRGIEQSPLLQEVDLHLDFPSSCADRVIQNKADIGIIPIQALLDIPNYEIISDYCIGTEGTVDSVFIFSDKPIEMVKTLRLDVQSKTSNGLARILLKHYWKNNDVQLVDINQEADAYVLIGDRTFGKKDSVPYAYDLGATWKACTNLPFAFAVWAANKPIATDFQDKFNQALAAGIQQIPAIVKTLPAVANFDLEDYLTHKLDFRLTPEKKQAIALYHTLYKQL